jgi:predicted ABC-type ATPase
VDAFIFDADKEIAKIEARYPGLPAESISYAVDQYFLDCVDSALTNSRDFTIETNFRDVGLMNIVNRFQENGYTISMVYLGLSDIQQSMDRVTARVAGGGHFVDTDSIRYNFEEGLKNLIYYAGRFDNVEFIDASGSLYELKSLLSAQNRQLVFLTEDPPEWAKQSLAQISRHFSPPAPDRDDDMEIRRGPRR